eukprot:scaffold2186_cov113-Cylindrotheca_fusiformis.AAC.5
MAESIEDDDEFFGNQEVGDDDFYGGLSKYELQSKEEEMKKIAFLQSYDETSESKVQEGFEAGYQETFDSAFRIGTLLGEMVTAEKFKVDSGSGSQIEKSTPPVQASRKVRRFVTSFQERANNKEIDDGKLELETFEQELQEISQLE